MAELRERLPALAGWVEIRGELPPAISISAWRCGPTCAISALEDAELPDGGGIGPQWHISVTHLGKRPRRNDLRRVFRAFRFQGAEEDNHHPGNARHFWIPVERQHRVTCQCKVDEDMIVEPDGYAWTNPKEGPCRGCEFERTTGRPCPLHHAEVAHG